VLKRIGFTLQGQVHEFETPFCVLQSSLLFDQGAFIHQQEA
jgi:hypothetical protein